MSTTNTIDSEETKTKPSYSTSELLESTVFSLIASNKLTKSEVKDLVCKLQQVIRVWGDNKEVTLC